MPKGTTHNPSYSKDGFWFQHKNCHDYMATPMRQVGTSTGSMLDSINLSLQPKPPTEYVRKDRNCFSADNPFSNHDNRNTIQLNGEYLGDGRQGRTLGRHLKEIHERLHNTTKDYLKHDGRETTEHFYYSNYVLSHAGAAGEPATKRRFARHHAAGTSGLQPLTTTTTCWDQSLGSPIRTHTQVLVSSLEPFAKHNQWKYATHGIPSVYPKVWGDREEARKHTRMGSPHHVFEKVDRLCST